MRPMATRDLPHFEDLDPQMVRVLAAMSGSERLAIANGMFRSAQRMIAAMLREQNPGWTDADIEAETARRIALGSG